MWISAIMMYGEAQAAESRDDFIHKMKLLIKELRETRACLKLISRKEMINPIKKLEPLRKENEELIAIISSSIETAKRNNQKNKKNDNN
ncbi:MAG TPA: four helix bundle protein [Parafilimonas sp.]|jgi:four helix bundle protein